jgi:hypothetical protein
MSGGKGVKRELIAGAIELLEHQHVESAISLSMKVRIQDRMPPPFSGLATKSICG